MSDDRAAPPGGGTGPITAWEYTTYYVGTGGTGDDQDRIRLEINALGSQGWEMCGCDNGYLFFKREV